MKDFAADYQTEVYEAESQNFIADTDSYIAAHEDEILANLREEIGRHETAVAKQQEEERLPPVAYMTFSALYTSVYFQRPQMRLDFYDAAWIFGEPLYTAYLDLPWLFARWDAHRTSLDQAARAYSSRVSARHIQQSLWRSVRALTYLAAQRMKYWSAAILSEVPFSTMKRESSFYVTCGEYQDWQETVYALLPPIDLFDHKSLDSLRQRDYAQLDCKGRALCDLDLRGSRFRRCSFEDTVFERMELSDCLFEDCIFQRTVFRDTKMLGITAKNTAFSNISFASVEGGVGSIPPRGIFKAAEFVGCKLESVHLRDCCFNDSALLECVIQDLSVESGSYENSGFSEFVKEGAEES